MRLCRYHMVSMPQLPPSLKLLYCMGLTRKDLRDSLEDVKDGIGYALELVQKGEKPANAKPLKGFRGGEGARDRRGSRRRHMACGLRVAIADAIYVQLLPEEIEDGHPNAEEGD